MFAGFGRAGAGWFEHADNTVINVTAENIVQSALIGIVFHELACPGVGGICFIRDVIFMSIR